MNDGFRSLGQLLREICMSYARTKVWVWFKGELTVASGVVVLCHRQL